MTEYDYEDIYVDPAADADRSTVLIILPDAFIKLTPSEARKLANRIHPDRRITR